MHQFVDSCTIKSTAAPLAIDTFGVFSCVLSLGGFKNPNPKLGSLFPPTSHRPEHHLTGQPLIGCPLHGPRKEDASFGDDRLDAFFALCQGLDVRHEVVAALSALEAP